MPHIRSQMDDTSAIFTYSKVLAGNSETDWVNRVDPQFLG